MKLPRISVGALMTSLVVVAVDCVIYRSVQSRPEFFGGWLTLIVLATLPMANLLSLVVGALIRGRAEARPSRVGFVVGGFTALVATIFGLLPALNQLELVLAPIGIGRWLEASPIRVMFAYYGFVVVLPLLFQILAGLVGRLIGRKVGARRLSESAVTSTSARLRFGSLVALVVLAAVPALAVEEYFRRKDDPALARLEIGSEAVVDLKNPAVGPLLLPKASPVRTLAGAKVRVEADREPYMIEKVASSSHNKEYVRDHRKIEVTILDGPRAGESTEMVHCLLRPIR